MVVYLMRVKLISVANIHILFKIASPSEKKSPQERGGVVFEGADGLSLRPLGYPLLGNGDLLNTHLLHLFACGVLTHGSRPTFAHGHGIVEHYPCVLGCVDSYFHLFFSLLQGCLPRLLFANIHILFKTATPSPKKKHRRKRAVMS